MTRRYLVAASFLAIAACATSGPAPQEPAATAAIPVTEQTSTSKAAADEVEFVEVLEVAEMADVRDEDEIVCRRERKTGSHRAKRVCRSRSSVESTEEKSKETFETLRRSQVEYE